MIHHLSVKSASFREYIMKNPFFKEGDENRIDLRLFLDQARLRMLFFFPVNVTVSGIQDEVAEGEEKLHAAPDSRSFAAVFQRDEISIDGIGPFFRAFRNLEGGVQLFHGITA